tara:strand:- start:4372 stop:4908 length:537 start_codon:yes stop_codon:yes gene_type:complete
MNGIVGAVKHVSVSKLQIHDLALGAYDCLAICRYIGSRKFYSRMTTAFQELPYATKLPQGRFALFSGWSYIETCPRDAKIHLLSVDDVADSLITELSWEYILFKLLTSTEYSSVLSAAYAFALNCPPHLQDSLLELPTITSPTAKVTKLLGADRNTIRRHLKKRNGSLYTSLSDSQGT